MICLDCLYGVFFTHESVGDTDDLRVYDPDHLSLVFFDKVYERDLLWSLKQSLTHEKLGLCVRNRLNPRCLINKNLVLVIIDLFLG